MAFQLETDPSLRSRVQRVPPRMSASGEAGQGHDTPTRPPLAYPFLPFCPHPSCTLPIKAPKAQS